MFDINQLGLSRPKSDADFRAKATYGVSIASVLLLLPLAVLSYAQGELVRGMSSLLFSLLVIVNILLVYQGRCHQALTTHLMLPAGLLLLVLLIRQDGVIGSLWIYPSIVACYCMLSQRRAWFANACILIVCIPMVIVSLPLDYAIRACATLLAISIFAAIQVRVIDKLNRQLQYQLQHDPLTNLLNRQTLKTKLQQSMRDHEKSGATVSALALDLDHFKTINDIHGHDTGDKTLVRLAQLIKRNLRSDDHAFRIGGEEFLILLNGSNRKQASIIAERLRREIEVADVVPGQAVTISVGVAEYTGNESWTQWMKRADNLLYEAKRLGRNRISLSSPPQLTTVPGLGNANEQQGGIHPCAAE